MGKEFYIEWLIVLTKYSRSFYEKMSLEELEEEYMKTFKKIQD
jgi:hypothetical protein